MNSSDEMTLNDTTADRLPPIRRPVIFYASVTVAYGFLAVAVIALILI